MNLTNLQILSSVPALQQLSGIALPVGAAFRVAQTMRKLGDAAQDYDAGRRALIDKHWQRDADGNKVQPTQPEQAPIGDPVTFAAEHNELLKIAVDVLVQRMQLSALGSISVPPSVLLALDWLFEE